LARTHFHPPGQCGAGRRDSYGRRVDDYRWTYEAVGRIEKPGDESGFSFSFAHFVFRK
jgi:hypothetical protein